MLESFDPQIHRLMEGVDRQSAEACELRPERNFLSAPVLEALGSSLADFYVEGFPGQRYSGSCEETDRIEALGNERLKDLFQAEAASLQPQSHAHAVAAVLEGLVPTGEVIMAPEPGQGSDLAFGHKSVAWESRYRFVRYGPDPRTLAFDRDALSDLVKRSRPFMIVVSLSSYPRRQDLAFWQERARAAKARLWVDLSMAAGLVPGGVLPSPAPLAQVVTGSTRGLFRGPAGGFIVCREELIDAVRMGQFPRMQAGAAVNMLAAKAVAFKEAASSAFQGYVEKAVALASMLSRSLQEKGLTLWTGGTDFHFLMLDLTSQGMTGLEGQKKLAQAGIQSRRIRIPFVAGCTNQGNGVMLATQALTLQGMDEDGIAALATKIYAALK